MKVFVIVGTGSFEQLIEQVDKCLIAPDFTVCCQIGVGRFKPHQPYYALSDNYKADISHADVVVTHAGAATVFELLESGKKMLVVPNQFRIDKHQQDLAEYVEQQNLAGVCWHLDDLKQKLLEVQQSNYQPYQKESFFKARELLDYFGMANER